MEDIQYRNGELSLRIPPTEFASEVKAELRYLEGRVHDSEFNKVDISHLDFNFEKDFFIGTLI